MINRNLINFFCFVIAFDIQLLAEGKIVNDPSSLPACKLKSSAFTNVGIGFPNPVHKLPTIGIVETKVLFADFNDAPASHKPEELFSQISPDAEAFFHAISYGKMDYHLTPHFVWLRLSQPSSYYGNAIRSYYGHLEFIQEAVDQAVEQGEGFSLIDSVLVLVPPGAKDIPYGPAFGANPGHGYTAEGKTFSNGVTSGADLPFWGFLWLNHETGHAMGLPDLYAYESDESNTKDLHRFVGTFGLMGNIGGSAPEFFAFERWQMSWLDDDQIVCQQEGEGTVTLTAIEIKGGKKAVMIPISENKVVVVESRKRLGYDTRLVKEGALVYTVDTSIPSGYGPIVVYPKLEDDRYRYKSPLAPGESVTVDGVTIKSLNSTSDTDTLHISKNGP